MRTAAATAKKRPPLHPLERALLVVASLHLILLPWCYSLERAWTQVGSAGLAGLAFIIALWPRTYDGVLSDGPDFKLHPWWRLVRFPLFWLGLPFLGLMVAGAFNPSWFYETNGYRWGMLPLPNIAWLPTSADTPFAFYNVWRTFAVYASAWLLVCALWIGVTRRRALQILCWVLVANGLALVTVGLIHRFSGPEYEQVVLWQRFVRNSTAFGAFTYRNHAGAYLCLIAAVAVSLAAWSHYEGRRRMAHSTPGPVWLFVAFVFVAGIAYTYARSSVLIVLLFMVLALLGWFVLRLRLGSAGATPKLVTATLMLLLAGTGVFALQQLDFSKLEKRFEAFQKMGEKETSYRMRVESRERVIKMWEDHWVRGTGAGSFRFLFPNYIRDNKFISGGGRYFWEHAHIDWLEIPIEQGIAGVLLIAVAYFWWLWRWIKAGGWGHPFALMIFLGSLQTLIHAGMDFPFQHPGVLVTWWALLIMALRWAEFEAPKTS
ncbi:MAG: O-antigen ligase family protein [Candidatus Didemnitutus sp.]|nr:O-antigen ligase family protein [Candidatus Didemnitutus sp.]